MGILLRGVGGYSDPQCINHTAEFTHFECPLWDKQFGIVWHALGLGSFGDALGTSGDQAGRGNNDEIVTVLHPHCH